MSILQSRKSKAAALAASLTAPIAGFESSAHGAGFQSGDVIVYRVGDGANSLSNNGTQISLVGYTPGYNNGAPTLTLDTTLTLPTTSAGVSNPLVGSGTANSEGQLSQSSSGGFLLLAGYDANVGTASVASSNSTMIPREVGIVNLATGTVDTSTTTTSFNGNNIRSAAWSGTGSTLYVGGASSPGAGTIAVDGSGAVTAAGNITNVRQLQVLNGTLYETTQSSTNRLDYVSANTSTEVSGVTASGTNNTTTGFSFANAGSTLYIADGSSTANVEGVYKFVLVSGTAGMSNATYSQVGAGPIDQNNGIEGVTVEPLASADGSQIFNAIFYTTPTSIHEIIDFNNGTYQDTSVVGSAGTDYNFRGIDAVPEPTAVSSLLLAGGAALLRRRRGRPIALE